MTVTAGVVAVQGDVSEHARAIERAAETHGFDTNIKEVRTAGIVPECDVLLLPGGESTTISRLVHREGIAEELIAHTEAGKPILATCAGLILVSSDSGDDRVETVDLLDVEVERNAFGRQRDSFEAPLSVAGLAEPFPSVFIRAPAIERVSDDVEILAEWDGRPVAVRQGPLVGTAFHPELTADSRIHDLAFFEDDTVLSVP
ncbi:pyridoxal 5'-phosphate synthase glutaminase subunit PdxT [Halovenus rubra]|uniref:Pyridoxal 5'-phosphate synthase glutaminase subunit PdxT n=2 Tax=Halovenus rubra TaxID=869890 RepID=A0ACC7DZD6_9EURY|nr:pyridoxal 5'-phosphate synthase glutaminase subunit PdxT [Halovenus rubra]